MKATRLGTPSSASSSVERNAVKPPGTIVGFTTHLLEPAAPPPAADSRAALPHLLCSQRDQAEDLFPWSCHCDKCMCKKWSGFVLISMGKENTLCKVCNPDKNADTAPKFIHTGWCRGQSLLAKLV
ncbi:unnamed protein product [Ixodes hexagonus]